MFKFLFSLFIIVHTLGDFYIKSNAYNKKEQVKYKSVIFNGLVYFVVSVIAIMPFWSLKLLLSACALSAFHFVIENIRSFFYLSRKETSANYIPDQVKIYIADQVIHIAFITGLSLVLANDGYTLRLLPGIKSLLALITGSPEAILSWTGVILVSGKPANVTIKQLAAGFKPAGGELDSSVKAGAFIGTLERIIIVVLLSLDQYSAIGLVLTAKSIARYNKISEDKQFAEYYLVGTLLSTLFAICTYLIFF